MRAPDPAFADPRLAALYDVFDDDRSDLDAYLAIADELGANSVIDVGCGTGSLAIRLADTGKTVLGVDPAGASLDVARAKSSTGTIRWVHGDATALVGLGLSADMATMTGNVAQVFVSDDDWYSTLAAVHHCLRPGGWLVFETRRADARDWEHWDVTPTSVHRPDGSTASFSRTVSRVSLPLVTFESEIILDGQVLISASTLRFRDRHEIEDDLHEHGYRIVDVRDAPDRPGKELVFLARRAAD